MRSRHAVPLSPEKRKAVNALLREAARQLCAGLPTRPEPRHRFDRLFDERAATPWSPVVDLLAMAAHAGQSAETLCAVGDAFVAAALLLVAPPTVDEIAALHHEQVQDAAADVEQARAWHERTPSAYLDAARASLRASRAQRDTAQVLLHAAHRPARRPVSPYAVAS